MTSLDLCFKKHMTVLWEMDFGENGINQGDQSGGTAVV